MTRPDMSAERKRCASAKILGVIREFTSGDQVAVRDLVLAGLRERWGEAYDASANPDLDDISKHHVDRGAEVVVVEIEGEVVATGTLRPEPDGRGRIVRMSVDAHRRREGLGRQVVEELVRRARDRGMIEVVVLTDTPWTSAMALYRSCGFDEVGRDDTDTYFTMSL
jgi:GNAT superfamily N-acetyltransferase